MDLNSKRLTEVTALSQDQYKVRENLHAGMLKKPLEPYHPNAFRSRLPQPTVVMPYKNSSQIVIGDRSTYNKRQFVSTNQNTFVKPKAFETTNTGIISESTKRAKHLQELWGQRDNNNCQLVDLYNRKITTFKHLLFTSISHFHLYCHDTCKLCLQNRCIGQSKQKAFLACGKIQKTKSWFKFYSLFVQIHIIN